MIDRWAEPLLDSLPGPGSVFGATLLVSFLAWVLVSEQRTRHLAQLIRALRGRADPGRRRGHGRR